MRNSASSSRPNWLLIAVLVGVLFVLGAPITSTPVAGGPAFTPDAGSPFGIAGTMRWPKTGTYNVPADAFLQTGASWTREDFVWGLIEPAKNRFDWSSTDAMVRELSSRNINVLGIISGSANWATPATEDDGNPNAQSYYAPNPDEFYTYVKALVTHFKDSVHYWEVWNEPNNPLFWQPKPDARAYAELLKAGYRAVKEANPSAKVLTAGMSGSFIDFFGQMIDAGAGDSFDILALHTYATPLDPAQGAVQSRPEVYGVMEIELTKYRALLQRHGYNRPIWVTETGWPASDWQLNPSLQADYLAQDYALMLASGIVDRVFWYAFKDEGSSAGQSWGLVSWGNGQTDLSGDRPSMDAYKTSAAMLAGAKGMGRTPFGKWQIIEDFEGGAQAAWERRGSSQGSLAASAGQAHTGSQSGKLEYNFSAPNQSVDFAPAQPLAIPGRPTRLGMWVRGDGSGNFLNIWLKDKDGELLFEMRLGALTAAADGWRYYEGRVNNYYFSWQHNPGPQGNGVVDYPVQVAAFRLENVPDGSVGSGTIYVDDLQSFDGPDASMVRFSRPDGNVVDVLWSVDPTQVSLPTRSSSAQVVSRDGSARQVAAANGALQVSVSSSPIYVVHKPADALVPLPKPDSNGGGQGGHQSGQGGQGGQSGQSGQSGQGGQGSQGQGGQGGQQGGQGQGAQTSQGPDPSAAAACAAYAHATPLSASDNRYFSETGHNVHGSFLTYWQQHGSLGILGYPITEEFRAQSSDGNYYVQQYFQRARLEFHPENTPPNDVLGGLLGVWITADRSFPRTNATPSDATSTYFPQTGHTLRLFKSWWERNGGLAVFGYPLSDEISEVNAADGKTYTVQYFERNRLEYHPEFAGTNNEVLLGLLGGEFLARQGCH